MGMKPKKIKKIILFLLLVTMAASLLAAISGCSGSSFVPGASYGYFIWEDSGSDIHIAWSVDKKDTVFKGSVSTDGTIEVYELIDFEESDEFDISAEKDRINFNAELSAEDFSDKIILSVKDYSYIEFDLKINDGYDLSRTNVGGFLNNPPDGVFRIEKGYFDKVDKIPAYQKHPLSGFLSKLAGDIRFTVFYIFIIGIVIIEIIRITILRKNKKNNWYLILCYGVLVLIEITVYILLRRFG